MSEPIGSSTKENNTSSAYAPSAQISSFEVTPASIPINQQQLRAQTSKENVLPQLSASPSIVGTSHGFVAVRAKSRRFRFTDAADYLLLEAVRASEAHVAPHGEKLKRFDHARSIFSKAAGQHEEDFQPPVRKTFIKRFDKLVRRRRRDVKRSQDSGHFKRATKITKLLDKITAEIDDSHERRRQWEGRKAAREQKLASLGAALGDLARSGRAIDVDADDESFENELVCDGSDVSGTDEEDYESEDRVVPVVNRKRPLSSVYSSEDDERELERKDRRFKRKVELRKMELESKRLELQRKSMTETMDRFERDHNLQMKRIELEEKRIDLDRARYEVEEKNRSEERKAMVGLLKVMAEKIQK